MPTATKKKPLGTNIPGTSNVSLEDNQIVVLGDFDENGNFIAFIGPGGRRFTAGTSGVNQLTAGDGISLNPPGGVGTVQVTNTRQGTVQSVGLQMPPSFTVRDSPITVSGDLQVEWGPGLVPPTVLTSGPYRSDYYINSQGMSVPVIATSIPYIGFLGSATGGANQTFTNPTLGAYAADETRMTVLVNGVAITPVESFVLNGDILTILDYLAPNAEVDVISKAITAAGVSIGTVSNVSVSTNLENALRVLTPTSTPVIDLATTIVNPTTSFLRGDGVFNDDPSFITRHQDVNSPYRATLATPTVTSLTATTLTVSSAAGFFVGQFISAKNLVFTSLEITAINGLDLTVSSTTQWGSTPPTVTTPEIYTWFVPAEGNILIYSRANQRYNANAVINSDFVNRSFRIGNFNAHFGDLTLQADNITITHAGTRYLTGSRNTVVGSNAGVRLQGASNDNTCIGYSAGEGLTTNSTDNIAIGSQSFLNAFSALHTNNIAIGSRAMSSIGVPFVGANNNIAIGSDTLGAHQVVNSTVAIGVSALQNIVNANNSTAVGHQAGRAITSGAQNQLFGYQAGNTLLSGGLNLFVGYQSGLSCTLSSGNTIIGAFSGIQTSLPAKPTDLDITTTNNNYFVISDNRPTPNILAVWDNNQNLGLGNSSPLAKLHIEGGLRIQQAYEKVYGGAGALTGIVVVPVGAGGTFFYNVNAAANWQWNFTGNNPDAVPATTASLDSILPIGHSVTVSLVTTQGATAFYCTGIQVDGVAVTPRWQGPTAPAFGNANSLDIYTFVIFKTAAATFTATGSRTQYGG